MGKILVVKKKLIQAVLLCKKCGQFLNLYADQRQELFSNVEYKSDDDEYDMYNWRVVSSSLGFPATSFPIVTCKCKGAISGDPDLFKDYEEDTDRFESYFIRNTDSRRYKKESLVGRFENTSRKKIYYGLIDEADNYHIKRNCTFEGPFISELREISEEIVKERGASHYFIGESIDMDVLEKLKSKFAS